MPQQSTKKLSRMLLALFFIGWAYASAEIEIYFAPKGGFSPQNNERTITLKNGQQVPATLNNALLDLIARTEDGGTIKIAMYAFGHRAIQDALIDAAKNRDIKVKVILDAVAAWTEEIRSDFKNRIFAETKACSEARQPFDFQLKEIYPQAMKDRERTRKLADGKIIYGTMHEKFGIFFHKNSNIPIHSFCGSANISWSAGQVFAENRIFFKHEPGIGRQLAEEFARLWNEYGTPVTKNCQSEKFIPSTSYLGDVQIISNAKPIDESRYQSIDKYLLDLMQKVDPKNGTIDIAMFSFTHIGLAQKLLSLAARYPKIKIRIALDPTQIEDDENHRGVLGPYLERTAYFKKLKNIEIRYKWRSNAFAWDAEANKCQLIHWRNLLLHHKCMIVNKKHMGIGSYNWSTTAEYRNFENIMIFDGIVAEHQKIIDRFMYEYDVIWNSVRPQGRLSKKLPNPQVVTGEEGRRLKKIIIKTFEDPACRNIMGILDTNPAGCSKETLSKLTSLNAEELQTKLDKLEKATLIFGAPNQEKTIIYQLAD